MGGSDAKLALLRQESKNGRLKDLICAALDYRIVYFVNKFDDPDSDRETDNPKLHDEFLALLEKLSRRELTGDAARSAVTALLSRGGRLQRKWYPRVIRKDLKTGFGVSLAVEAGFPVPDFDVMLAKDGKKGAAEKALKKGPLWCSPKFNGYRCVSLPEAGEIAMYSRSGTKFENFPEVQKELTKRLKGTEWIPDGEIMSDNFNLTQRSAFASKRRSVVGDVKYHIFDLITAEEWRTGRFTRKATRRFEELAELFETKLKDCEVITHIKHHLVHTLAECYEWEKRYIAQGYEGAMLLPDIVYYLGKHSNRLMKFKTMHSMDCKIVDTYEGERDTKYRGTLGGLIVEQENGKECGCGSGFDDAERDELWANRRQLIGRMVECRYQELTPDGIMQFPVFVRFRDSAKAKGKKI